MTIHPESGVCAIQLTKRKFTGSPCLFLDRDGVVVEETNYLHTVDDIHFISDVASRVAQVNALGIPVVMITNQAGIGRGYYGWNEFMAVQEHIYAHFAAHGAHFDMILACAYHEAGLGAYAVAGHDWRKPKPGMLKEAARVLELDLARSFVIGDTVSDLLAGEAAGLSAGALVMTGHGRHEWEEKGQAQFRQWEMQGFAASRHADAAQAITARWSDAGTRIF